MMNGTEPSLAQLLSTGSVSGRNPITLGNVSTYIDGAAIGNAQINGNIYSENYYSSGGTAGWLLDRAGNLIAKTGTFSGDITGASGKFSGDLDAAGGTFSGNVSAKTLSAQSMNVALRTVLETGSIEIPASYFSGNNYESGAVIRIEINKLVATNIYDSYLMSSTKQQPFKSSCYMSGTGQYWGGAGLFNLSITSDVVVNRRFSVNGVNTTNDTRVYVYIKYLLVTNDAWFTAFNTPTTVNWILSRA